jgi:hypothetical protein
MRLKTQKLEKSACFANGKILNNIFQRCSRKKCFFYFYCSAFFSQLEAVLPAQQALPEDAEEPAQDLPASAVLPAQQALPEVAEALQLAVFLVMAVLSVTEAEVLTNEFADSSYLTLTN